MDQQQEESHSQSPFLAMFETFRKELDEHHDRRERTIKASRDVTAASKKIIFTLQRVRKLAQPLPPNVQKGNTQYYDTIRKQYAAISGDLQGLNTYRYARNITGGNQEYMEAACFEHYLTTGKLISYDEARQQLHDLGGEGGPIDLSIEDYLLGVFDMTGELMRFAITTMATSGKLPSVEDSQTGTAPGGEGMDLDSPAPASSDAARRDILTDLRELRAELETLNVGRGNSLSRDVEKKMDVMQTSVEKVEKALYGLVIRGRERPKGWMPDLDSGPRREVGVEG